jgi:hypothetical protein
LTADSSLVGSVVEVVGDYKITGEDTIAATII